MTTQTPTSVAQESETHAPAPVVSPAPEIAPLPPRSRRRLRVLIVAVVLVGLAVLIWRIFFAAPAVPPNIVTLSGRIEGDDSAVASKTMGRILEVHVREGDLVNAGDVIAVLDDEQVRAREQQAQAALTVAQAKARSAQAQMAVLQELLNQNQLSADQSKEDAAGRVRQADAELAAAEADLAQQEASLKLALFDKDAYTRLAQNGAVSERQGKLAISTADQQAASVAAAKRRVEASKGALTTAQANLSNPGIHQAQVAGVRGQLLQQSAEIASDMASSEQARYELVEAQANRQDLLVRAPFTGTVITRAAEPGEVVTAGTAIVTLLDLSKVYLRGFIPEGEIGKVRIGQPAHVYLDSNTRKPLDASVTRIDPQATFTPENTYFRDDRVKQVVGVKLQLKTGIGYAKPGMPADGEVLVQGDTWPAHKAGK